MVERVTNSNIIILFSFITVLHKPVAAIPTCPYFERFFLSCDLGEFVTTGASAHKVVDAFIFKDDVHLLPPHRCHHQPNPSIFPPLI